MNSLLLGIIGILLYLLATVLSIKSIRQTDSDRVGYRRLFTPLPLAGLAAIFHTASLLLSYVQAGSIDFSFFPISSLVSLIVVVLLLITALNKPVEKLGIIIFPTAAILLSLSHLLPTEHTLLENPSPGMEIHILFSILAFSLLNIAAVQALLLALQDWQLHNRNPNWFIRSFPPLQTMETLLFQMIAVGLGLLTVSLGSGFYFLHDLFGQHLAHKTVLSLIAWFVFGVLLWGRSIFGWRGQTAIRWTLGGFATLVLAYFGSKLVLEIILDRV
ncbi:MAG: cytochrome c biogenesis protein CcsA [Methylococcales bacterium]